MKPYPMKTCEACGQYIDEPADGIRTHDYTNGPWYHAGCEPEACADCGGAFKDGKHDE